MPLVNLSMAHGTTAAEAEANLARTAEDVTGKFGAFVRSVEWDADRRGVKFAGPGAWVRMTVDATHVHCEGDIPALAGLLGGGARNLIEGAVKKRFPKALPAK